MNESTTSPHFHGLRTAIYRAPDLDKAKAWYSRVLGIAPYFDQPFYVGFSVGGYELGLDPDALGATGRTAVQDVGEGIRVATVLDPFGNVLGIIENPHFKLSTDDRSA